MSGTLAESTTMAELQWWLSRQRWLSLSKPPSIQVLMPIMRQPCERSPVFSPARNFQSN